MHPVDILVARLKCVATCSDFTLLESIVADPLLARVTADALRSFWLEAVGVIPDLVRKGSGFYLGSMDSGLNISPCNPNQVVVFPDSYYRNLLRDFAYTSVTARRVSWSDDCNIYRLPLESSGLVAQDGL